MLSRLSPQWNRPGVETSEPYFTVTPTFHFWDLELIHGQEHPSLLFSVNLGPGSTRGSRQNEGTWSHSSPRRKPWTSHSFREG